MKTQLLKMYNTIAAYFWTLCGVIGRYFNRVFVAHRSSSMLLYILSIITVLAISNFPLDFVFSEDKPNSNAAHEEHHTETSATTKKNMPAGEKNEMMKKNMMNKEMMGNGMDMTQMKEKMHNCTQHKEGEKCEHEVMEECHKNMDSKACQKNMKQIKSQKK